MLPAHNYRDQYYEYGEPDQPHRCGGACGRPGCREAPQGYREVPQGYSHTVPIRDEGYGQPERATPGPQRTPFTVPRVPRSRSLITVTAVLTATALAGLIGAELGSDIDLFGAAESAVVRTF
ncbi:hypothetical protein ACFXK0_21185 [Nocardia sp. NPDC059177]|uniref:hypothetical protein n=1 Tax=Nocardia sp. NPDC059177 TaxID=3346759 RepID=UPI0036CE00D8